MIRHQLKHGEHSYLRRGRGVCACAMSCSPGGVPVPDGREQQRSLPRYGASIGCVEELLPLLLAPPAHLRTAEVAELACRSLPASAVPVGEVARLAEPRAVAQRAHGRASRHRRGELRGRGAWELERGDVLRVRHLEEQPPRHVGAVLLFKRARAGLGPLRRPHAPKLRRGGQPLTGRARRTWAGRDLRGVGGAAVGFPLAAAAPALASWRRVAATSRFRQLEARRGRQAQAGRRRDAEAWRQPECARTGLGASALGIRVELELAHGADQENVHRIGLRHHDQGQQGWEQQRYGSNL
mmetsp:Transcript_15830/g.32081  ORF Transcript_15830/g.32081 Transcript_15830/m.32081 type:complete len:297 (-) Transcript_15830:44-934(-)